MVGWLHDLISVHDMKTIILFFTGLVCVINGLRPQFCSKKIGVFSHTPNMPISAKNGTLFQQKHTFSKKGIF